MEREGRACGQHVASSAVPTSDAQILVMLTNVQVDEPVATVPTIGFNVETLQYKNIKFQVWDLGGQSTIRPYWRCYYPNTDAIIFVVDSADTERLEIARAELHAMLEVCTVCTRAYARPNAWQACICLRAALALPRHRTTLPLQEADLEKSILLVFANKQDMKGALKAPAISEALGLASIKERQWSIQETSAANGTGLHEGFDWLVTAIQAVGK